PSTHTPTPSPTRRSSDLPRPPLSDRASRALRRLFEKPEPNVSEGNARAIHGDVEGALQAYEKAQAPETGPGAAALAHDRASALRSEEHTSELQSLRHLVC